MKETYIKKYWKEDNILFYLHFQNEQAVRQIEISSTDKIYLSLENPIQDESFLYDKDLQDLDLKDEDFITKQEFEQVWNSSHSDDNL